MNKLDRIEADLHRHARRSDPPVFQDHGKLLIQAMRLFADRYWDVRLAHEDPEDNDYNGCDNGLCAWCELPPEILELIHGS